MKQNQTNNKQTNKAVMKKTFEEKDLLRNRMFKE